jgi:hypothetical protein
LTLRLSRSSGVYRFWLFRWTTFSDDLFKYTLERFIIGFGSRCRSFLFLSKITFDLRYNFRNSRGCMLSKHLHY